MKLISVVDGYTFPQGLSDNETYIKQNNLKGLTLLKFRAKLKREIKKADKRLKETQEKGKCYYGPFKGEFGHFTAHTLPFLMYLHKQGVKIIYCGMELHKPLMVDEQGNSIIHDFRTLRDFFGEVGPTTNATIPPKDVQAEIKKFEEEAESSGFPFWNIGDNFYYWFIHRNWLLEGYTHTYDLSKFYKTAEEKSCVIFPRGKGAKFSLNNGARWDYQQVVDVVKPYFDKVYICGHPSQSLDISEQDKVEIRLTANNVRILEACSNSELIITQHSGVNNLGEYVNVQVLIIYKGGDKVEDIGSMNNTLRFRHGLNQKFPLNFAFSLDQIEEYVKRKSKEVKG